MPEPVGDATMSPYEITYPGGSVEHWNEEPGAIWVDRVTQFYESVVWLNPVGERHWDYTPSIGVMRQASAASKMRSRSHAPAVSPSPSSPAPAWPWPRVCSAWQRKR